MNNNFLDMDRVNQIWSHPAYQEHYKKIQELESERIFCRHTPEHFLDVARLMYIYALEEHLELPKELIYAAALLHDIGRAQYVPITDEEAVSAFEYLSRIEGIIPAIESSHALAYARKLAPTMNKDQIIVVNISGRGDKDVAAIARYRGGELYE